ncbi:MAG: uracil-DNA glycosylase [Tenuifilaceae bacterium]|nr:uracil-DNA glycosylase [Tenuifilaceae bacterium]
MSIDLIRNEINLCKRCSLCKDRIVPVVDNGNLNSKVIFIAREPGADEQKGGVPLIGRAGKLFNNMLSSIGLTRNDIWTMNIVACRTPNNRESSPEEVAACEHIRNLQINLIKPKIIVTLGALATKTFIKSDFPISKIVGKWYNYNEIDILPTFHPSFLLRSSTYKDIAYKHLLMLKDKLAEVNI